MKRFALATLLVTALAASVFLVLNRPGATASPGKALRGPRPQAQCLVIIGAGAWYATRRS
jgi:hypothetical protein